MIRYLTLSEILELHELLLLQSGGSEGIRDLGTLESEVAQPLMTFGDVELYPSVSEKAATLAFSLIQNHPFVDGNKRIGHAAMEVMLVLNGFEIQASVDEQEQLVLNVASSSVSRSELIKWLEEHLKPIE